MYDILRALAVYQIAASWPILAFIAAVAAARTVRLSRLRIPWKTLSIGLVILMVGAAAAYLVLPILFEDSEADIASIAVLAQQGHPIYPAPTEAPLYLQLYGPLTYLIHIPFYLAFGRNLAAFKLPGFLAFLTCMAAIYGICRRYTNSTIALIGLGCTSLFFFRFVGVEFWGRTDPLLLALTSVSILTILAAPAWAVVLVNSLALAAVPNLKASAMVDMLPILGLLFLVRGWKLTVLAASIALGLVFLPFALPEASLTNYVFALTVAGSQGLSLDFFLRNVQYSAVMLAPVAALAISSWKTGWRPTSQQSTYAVLILIAMGATCILGSKTGAGSYHLLPCTAPIVHLYFWLRKEPPYRAPDSAFSRIGLAWAATMLFYSTTHVGFVVGDYQSASYDKRIIAEIRAVEARYPGSTLEIGIGDSFGDRRIEYSFITTFDGQPLTFNGTAVRDLQLAGVPIPEATIRYVESCGTKVFLIPNGQDPFHANNTYYTDAHPAFDERFRRAFLGHYAKRESGEMFDVWSCDHKQ